MASEGRVGWAARRAAYRLAEWLREPQEQSLRSWVPCYGVERTPHTATAGALQDVRVDQGGLDVGATQSSAGSHPGACPRTYRSCSTSSAIPQMKFAIQLSCDESMFPRFVR
jgi:hypothetical protein